MLIGLTGKKRSGKDTVAARLVEEHGFTRLAFADALREACLGLDPYVLAPGEDSDRHWRDFVRLSEVIEQEGWEEAKRYPDVRRTLQNYGVAIREIVPSFWLDIVRDKAVDVLADGGHVVITDVRFPNELDLVAEFDGFHVNVTRAGLVSTDQHVSETALDDVVGLADVTIANDGSLAELAANVDEMVEVLLQREEARA